MLTPVLLPPHTRALPVPSELGLDVIPRNDEGGKMDPKVSSVIKHTDYSCYAGP